MPAMSLIGSVDCENRKHHEEWELTLSSGGVLKCRFSFGDVEMSWNSGESPDVPAYELTQEASFLLDKKTILSNWKEGEAPEVAVYSKGSTTDVYMMVAFHQAAEKDALTHAAEHLRRNGLIMVKADANIDGTGTCELMCRPIEGATAKMSELLEIATYLHRSTLRVPELQPTSAASALATLQEGDVWKFIGLKENEWLEVKTQLPDISKASGKFTLAKDITQFANSRIGGVLIYGFYTKNSGQGDTIRKVSPISFSHRTEEAIRAILQSHTHPPVAGLLIHATPIDSGHVVCVYVPPQNDSAKPFIVEGSGLSELGKGNIFSIPVRSGDRIAQITGKALHVLLAGKIPLSG
ncbi:helix-turn-helix domain-containing protein [Streptomyces sp. NPDC056707]|uniref:AlbA family DNA-binding domain-containing protein n=1 Tax=Streptomyces sp. NPDC056707 TaxID=3345919 RepID=UPI0036CA47F9